MPKSQSSKQIRIAYLLTFFLIGSLFTIDILSFYYFVWAGERSAVEINVAGRQRMLSQRIAFIANNFYEVRDEDKQDARSMLLGYANLMLRSHHALFSRDIKELKRLSNEGLTFQTKTIDLNNFVDYLSGNIPNYTEEQAKSLNRTVKEFAALAVAVAESDGEDYDSIHAITHHALFAVPQEFNDLVYALQSDAQDKSFVLLVFVLTIWTLMIVMMYATSKIIFTPLIKKNCSK